jgi:3-deoxy-D-manno-octulosonate 8-phosphate phosphatase (KDO 8-P phosphatase)
MSTINYKALLQNIKVFCFDVDGVFTNNTVLCMPDGEQIRTANVRDGYATQLAVKRGLHLAIISGGKSEGVRKRFEMLGLTDIFLGSSDKIAVLEQFMNQYGFQASEICYMGDDMPDVPVLERVGLACCPSDACMEVKAVSHYISPFKGGEGCVRDVLEQALKLKQLWEGEGVHIW